VSKDSIDLRTWKDYLDDLYEWIQEKYTLYEEDKILEDEYNEHLEYYMREKERIEDIIAGLESNENHEQENKSSFLSQQKFEQFFGVTMQDEFQKIDQEQQIKTPTQDNSAVENVWELVSDDDEHLKRKGSEPVSTQRKNQMKVNILLIGDSAVGRTSIRRAWMGKHFIENHLTTIGASIEKKTISLDEMIYNITLTDLGGQDFYSGLRRNFYRNIDGAIIVFDLTRGDTFRKLDFWVKEMYREIKRLVPFMIVGNKKDSRDRQIPEKYGIRASAKYSRTTLPRFRVRYMETSAKTGENINEIFNTMCREIRDQKIRNQNN